MKLKRVFRKEFFITMFLKQNKWHKYCVLKHTFAVAFHVLKEKRYKMLAAALLHDIGKPICAFQDEKDVLTGEYSFHNHEEFSYQIIKKWKISSYTKNLVRYHYLIRAMSKSKEKNQISKYRRLKRTYDQLDENFKKDLNIFMQIDDLGKKSF